MNALYIVLYISESFSTQEPIKYPKYVSGLQTVVGLSLGKIRGSYLCKTNKINLI